MTANAISPARLTGLILLFWACASPELRGQELAQQFSNPREVDNQAYYTEVLGKTEGGGFYLRKYPQDEERRYAELLRYDANMRLRNERRLDMKKDRSLIFTGLLDERPLVITTRYSASNDITTVMARLLTPTLQDSSDNVFLFELSPSDAYGRIRVGLSENGRRLAFCVHEYDEPDRLHYHFFNANLQPVGEHFSNLPDSPALQLQSFRLAYPWGLAVCKPRRGDDPNEEQVIVINHFEQNRHLTYDLYNDSVSVNDLALVWNRRDSLFYIGGVYKYRKQDFERGFFWVPARLEKDRMQGHFLPFNKDILAEVNGMMSSIKGIRSLKFRQIIPNAEGGLILSAEKVEVSSQTVSDYDVYNTTQAYTRHYYNFLDVLTVMVDSTNQLQWYHVLKKEQSSVNDAGYYSSVATFVYPTQIHYYYNDLYRKQANLMKYVLYPSGETDSEIMVKGSDFGGKFIPKEAEQVSPYDILLPAYHQKEGALLLNLEYTPE
jgi:hypothetical protein